MGPVSNTIDMLSSSSIVCQENATTEFVMRAQNACIYDISIGANPGTIVIDVVSASLSSMRDAS